LRIPELSVRYRIAVIMLYLTCCVLGVVSIRKIPLEFMPKVEMPYINIILNYPGAGPAEMCKNLAEKVEEAISTMHGIEKIETHCGQGSAEVGVQLNSKYNTEYQVLEVRERLEQIKNQLPSGLPPILVFKFDTDQMPVIFASLSLPEKRVHFGDLLDRLIVRPIKTIEGVADVQFFGLEEKRVKVEIDQSRLNACRTSIIDVYGALMANNLNLSLGSIDHLGRKYAVRVIGEFKSLEEIRRLKLRPDLTLGDVARVDYEYAKPLFRARFNRNPAFMLMLRKEAGANTVEVCRQVEKKLSELLKDPQLEGAEVKVWFSQAEEITTALKDLRSSGLMGALLAFLVLLLYLRDFRATLIISLAIPTGLLITVMVMYFLGYTFNVITLSGLVISVGSQVDCSIVVMEVIYAHLEKGKSRLEAAVHGADEVGLAITASTSTNIIVFLPLIFSRHKEVSVLMGQLGVVTVIANLMSLLVSLTLVPLLASMLIKTKKDYRARWFELVRDKMTSWLNYFLDHRAGTLAALFVAFVISMSLFFIPRVIEKESLPKAMQHIIEVRLKFAQKPTEEEAEEKLKYLENLLLPHKDEWEVDTITSVMTPQFSQLFLVMKKQRSAGNTVDVLRDRVKHLLEQKIDWPGVTLVYEQQQMGGGPGGGGPNPTTIKVKGDDPDQVYYFAEQIRQRLLGLKSIKEIAELDKEGGRELHVEIDRDLARKYGFDPSQVAFSIEYMIRGTNVGKFTSQDRQLDLYLQLEEWDRRSASQLQEMTITNLEGKPVPLKNIARFEIKGVPERVNRENRRFTVNIRISPAVRDLSLVRKEAMARLADYRLPKGYVWVMGEEYQDMVNMLYDLALSMLLAIALVFIVMTIQFESFLLPFVIMFEIPLAAIGVALSLALTRSTLNILSGAGVLLLVGIVVNNAIVLVDHIHNLRKQGFSARQSLLQGSRDRMRPIAMTSLTTIIGLVPMAIGLNDTGRMVYSPLAIAVIGGMMVSTFFTPLAMPLIFSLTDSIRGWLKGLFSYMKEPGA
jgi:HAE1 family hydrophobic/amphiphilic exporter-1